MIPPKRWIDAGVQPGDHISQRPVNPAIVRVIENPTFKPPRDSRHVFLVFVILPVMFAVFVLFLVLLARLGLFG